MTWDFKYLQDEVKDLLNFNSAQTNQDFTAAQIKKSINRAYGREVHSAWLEGLKKYFHAVYDATWTSGSTTYEVPEFIQQQSILQVFDVTSSDPGHRLVFSDNGYAGDVFWKSRNILQWGTSGPSENKTLRFEFFAEPVDMSEDDDEPDLIFPTYREILVWAAGIDLRRRADEGSPGEWLQAHHDLRVDYWKTLSRGKPFSDVPAFKNSYPDAEVGFVY